MAFKFKGQRELEEYVKDTNVPSFVDFVNENLQNIVVWSIEIASNKPKKLYGIWRSRFVMSLKKYQNLHLVLEVKSQYDEQVWSLISDGVKQLIKGKFKTTLDAISSAAAATTSALKMLTDSHDNDNKKENIPSKNATEQEDTSEAAKLFPICKLIEYDDEYNMHYLAHKKSSDVKLQDDELNYLKSYQSDGTPKSDLLLLSAELLQKPELTQVEEEVLELSLFGIYNYLNPSMVEIYSNKKNGPMPTTVNEVKESSVNYLGEHAISMFYRIAEAQDINDALYILQTRKAALTREHRRGSDEYAMLSIMEKVIEDTELWSSSGDEQELTFYRRFACLLDVLFKRSDIAMCDGETACVSSRIATEVNKSVFSAEDVAAIYSRKIDLILKYGVDQTIVVCSNEWKKSKVTTHLKLKQQSKNLKVNACIINSLKGNDSILAMDVIGLNGYMYKLSKIDDYFIAAPLETIMIPKQFVDIGSFLGTMNILFYFRNFYKSLGTELRKSILKDEIEKDIGGVFASGSNASQAPQNFIFFKTKKRKRTNSDPVTPP